MSATLCFLDENNKNGQNIYCVVSSNVNLLGFPAGEMGQ